ncbi:MAG TPA: flagellar motor switch protein FliM [Verrucomicrobiae bacterium]|jgi:flagellar motor switch protein FliM
MSDASPPPSAPAQVAPPGPGAQPHDFRGSTLLSARQSRKLLSHETQFLNALEARVALLLRSEFPVKLASIDIVSYKKLTEGWAGPTHLILFKTEPLRGVSLLEIPLRLGLTLVDRLMGGPGRIDQANREISEIEKALLDQVVQIILEEWCNNWAPIKPLKSTVLGCESSGRFLQTAPPQTNMLTLAFDARLGDCNGQIKLAFPYSTLEPIVRQLCGGSEAAAETPAHAAPPAVQWNRCLDDVTLPVTAECRGLELSAREILNLKTGDVLPISPQLIQQICLRLGDIAKFKGRLGTVAGQWAVELTQTLKS